MLRHILSPAPINVDVHGTYCRSHIMSPAHIVVGANICRRSRHILLAVVNDDDDDVNNIIVIIVLDLIFIKVESSMQLFREINGYLFEHVKRTCMAPSDPNIISMLRFVLFLSAWKRAARHFCVCTHFLS